MPQPAILLTGFEPFGGESVNPSWQVAQALHGETLAGARVQSLCLPCTFGDALDTLGAALAQQRPGIVLALGQAGGRSDFSVERIAINVDDARIPCNAGRRPIDEPVVPGAPAAYFATLPIKAIVAALRSAGLPASVSQSAGTYVCNHVFYGLMHALRRRRGVRAGFMHLPLLPEQVAARATVPAPPSLPLATLVQGVRLALVTAVTTTADLRASGGAEA
ncbi:MAG: pyroglutamyl-peptidase I [Betaproteobacteria bacterium]|nr:pyroglutamyl-peptidase I [Betaproteobacteria bacterium]